VPGGTWSSSNITKATVDVYGNVVGVSLGPVVITYTAPSGCRDTIAMVVQTDCETNVRDLGTSVSKINIIPHPTNGDFYLSIPITGSVTVSVTDLYGRVVISKTVDVVKSNKVRFEESSTLGAGTYILKVQHEQQVLTEKMTVVK